MKRIVLLIDGTWNDEGIPENSTNVAKLSSDGRLSSHCLIKAEADDGTRQRVIYHPGVGTEFLNRIGGGALGLGLKKIVRDSYESLVNEYEDGDEIYILGFSRGAYAARALAGLIGASGIRLADNEEVTFDALWKNSRALPAIRKAALENLTERGHVHKSRAIKCVGVWDTVGSYGVPAGFGLDALARYFALWLFGFHDTEIGRHVEFGLHAIAVDEKRRPFVPTLWTAPKDKPPITQVEQTWFAGVHCNVGGGYKDHGLSDVSLIWMIARLQALTKLEFDQGNVLAATRPSIDGEVYNSSKGFWISSLLPARRQILSQDAIKHGAVYSSKNRNDVHVNEKVHWSVLEKRGRSCVVDGVADVPYNPQNLPKEIAPDKIAAVTEQETALLAPRRGV